MRADKKDSGKNKCVSSIDILPATEMIGNAHENLKISFEDILREKCPNTEFFLVLFSCIRTENGYLRIQENTGIQSEYRKIRTRKNSVLEQFLRSDSYDMTTMMTILSTLLSLNILVGKKLMPMRLSNLKDIKLKNINHAIIVQLNINSREISLIS